jgi:hypothetical protein
MTREESIKEMFDQKSNSIARSQQQKERELQLKQTELELYAEELELRQKELDFKMRVYRERLDR